MFLRLKKNISITNPRRTLASMDSPWRIYKYGINRKERVLLDVLFNLLRRFYITVPAVHAELTLEALKAPAERPAKKKTPTVIGKKGLLDAISELPKLWAGKSEGYRN